MSVSYPVWIYKKEGSPQSPEEMNDLTTVMRNHAENIELHFRKFSEINEQINEIKNISDLNLKGGIYPNDSLDYLSTLIDGLYYASTPGIYSNGLIALEGFYTIFKKIGNEWTIALEYLLPTIPVDQNYDPESSNAQSGKAVSQAISSLVKDVIGDNYLTLYITSTKGDLLDIDDLNTTLIVSVDRYFKDVTDEVISWQWTRESGLSQEAQDADEMWKIGKTTKDLVLTPADFTEDIFEYGHTFICTALLEGNKTINGKITI